MKLDKKSPAVIGFMQVISVAIYCALISSFFSFMEANSLEPEPKILGGLLMLFLLVFSAALCGTLVFGYPGYLIIQKETKRALKILGYTFLFAIIIFVLVLLILFLI